MSAARGTTPAGAPKAIAIPSAFTGEACYARRYPDVLADFCAGGVNTCKWSAIRDHWREHGKGEGRQFGCES